MVNTDSGEMVNVGSVADVVVTTGPEPILSTSTWLSTGSPKDRRVIDFQKHEAD